MPLYLLKGKRRKGICMRLGIYNRALVSRLAAGRNIWIHAVSVGEVMAIAPLIDNLRRRHPGYRIVFSTVTETGNAAARRILLKDDIDIYLPFDLSCITRKVMGYIKPVILVIAETELWPNLILTAHNMDVKVFLVNGRISDSSFRRYRAVRLFLLPVLRKIDLMCMQTHGYMERIVSLGAHRARVTVSGNMKFDSAFSGDIANRDKEILRKTLGLHRGERLVVAGSTHPGEEEMLLSAYNKLKAQFPGLRLVITPRHIERARGIRDIAKRLCLDAVFLSSLPQESPDVSGHVVIADVMGRLKAFYSIADIVFVGGSLARKGGQNMIEPSVFARPTILGPHTFNFHDIVDMFMEKQALMIVRSESDLVASIEGLLKDRDLAKSLGQKARSVVESNRGAVDKTLMLIENERVFL
jgi:3-deoxy-D-manno-octulosonic-acid transferase